MKTILVCSVGGSHQPIVKAIEENRPDFVCFVCSEDDPATGKPGSYEQIYKNGLFLRQKPDDEKPSLPNIPAQCALAGDRFEVIRVFADDLDDAYAKISAKLAQFARDFYTIIADYTGGTKSMSAALCIAALDNPEIQVQIVTGSRADLNKVKAGTEKTQNVNIERTRFRLRLERAARSWENYAYDDTVAQLEGLKARTAADRGRCSALEQLSRAFAEWDRFNHPQALYFMEDYMGRYGRQLAPYVTVLRPMAQKDDRKRELLLLLDLWQNALRRARQGRYDDAVGRVYRFLEWVAQWRLRQEHGIDASNVPRERIPPGLDLTADAKGRIRTALTQSWELLKHLEESPLTAFWTEHRDEAIHLLELRNQSVLAHGQTPLDQPTWEQFRSFVEDRLLAALRDATAGKSHGINQFPRQLPNSALFIFEDGE